MKTFLLMAALCAVAFSDDSLQCKACDDGVALLNYALDSPFTEGSLKTLLKEACAKLPKEYASGCASTTAEILDMLIKDIEGFTNVICSRTLNCPPPKSIVATKMRGERASQSGICGVFEKIFKDLPNEVDYFKVVCSQLPANEQASCNDFFTQHKDLCVEIAQDVLKKIVSEIPFLKCTLTASTVAMAHSDSESLECMACNDGVKLLDYALSAPFTQGSLESLLNDECAKLPAAYVNGCSETVNKTISMIVSDAIGFIDEICPKTLNCPPTSLTSTQAQTASGFCAVAEIFYKQLPDDVAGFVNICDKLSTKQALLCKQFFASEEPAIAAAAQRVLKKVVSAVPFVDCQLTA